jgi:hypothetical protein
LLILAKGEAGNDLPEPSNPFATFLQPTEMTTSHRPEADRTQEAGLLDKCSVSPFECLFAPLGEQARSVACEVDHVIQRIERTRPALVGPCS